MHQLHTEFMNLFFTVFFFFTDTSGYTSTAMRYSTVLASQVHPLGASIVVANFCSTDFLVLCVFCFFGILLINKFLLFMFFIWNTVHIKKKQHFFTEHNLFKKIQTGCKESQFYSLPFGCEHVLAHKSFQLSRKPFSISRIDYHYPSVI